MTDNRVDEIVTVWTTNYQTTSPISKIRRDDKMFDSSDEFKIKYWLSLAMMIVSLSF
jgi:hypothetical protein